MWGEWGRGAPFEVKLWYGLSRRIGRMAVLCLHYYQHQASNFVSFQWPLPSLQCNPQQLTNSQVPSYSVWVIEAEEMNERAPISQSAHSWIEPWSFHVWNEPATTTLRSFPKGKDKSTLQYYKHLQQLSSIISYLFVFYLSFFIFHFSFFIFYFLFFIFYFYLLFFIFHSLFFIFYFYFPFYFWFLVLLLILVVPFFIF